MAHCSFTLALELFLFVTLAFVYSSTIKSDDEPKLVSWKEVLQGVTEPFGGESSFIEPVWKQMKLSADQKAASLLIQQALNEYGQIMKHSSVFGAMPMEERYDIFLSMSKLLKIMGFHQRAEVLLFEAMSYTSKPYEAHLQLSLLYLDKENLEMAKLHLKNCLYFRETDVVILIHLAVILIAEGKSHEAKFFVSRVLSGLESRVTPEQKSEGASQKMMPTDFTSFSQWLEDLMARVFSGEFRLTSANTPDTYVKFTNLYEWIGGGELTGRFLFDLGQALYESGRPRVGQMMMQRGAETSDTKVEGVVSVEIVNMRLAMDYPVIPQSLIGIVESYLNMTNFISDSAITFIPIDIENIMDVYWSIPLLCWSGLPMWPVMSELMWRFSTDSSIIRQSLYTPVKPWMATPLLAPLEAKSLLVSQSQETLIEIGIIGGHMNKHPVGQMVLHRLLGIASPWNRVASGFRITLIAMALTADSDTEAIASGVARVVSLPMDTTPALRTLRELDLDILLFPDWQPFPDTQSVLIRTLRIAPVQVCFYVRGDSCASASVDYYIRPSQVSQSHLKAVPAAAFISNPAALAPNTSSSSEVSGSSNATSGSAALYEMLYRRPPWKERNAEQIVLLDWPLLSPSIIQKVAKKIAASDDAESFGFDGIIHINNNIANPPLDSGFEYNNQAGHRVISSVQFLGFGSFHPNEGQIFFEGQSVAMIFAHPTHVHPLMDDTLFKVLRSVPSLQLLIVIPESFFGHTKDKDLSHRNCWARKLVRRLWERGGDLFRRIRLLPSPLSDSRIIRLLERADLVLDTFPFGASFHSIALALSVGTPVVTLRDGIALHSSQMDLLDMRRHLHASHQRHYRNPLYRQIMSGKDVPWSPVVSAVSGFYLSLGHSAISRLVADSVVDYINCVIHIATDREASYALRISLLEIVDSASDASSDPDNSDLRDLTRFLRTVGEPWAAQRKALLEEKLPQKQQKKNEVSPGAGTHISGGGGDVSGDTPTITARGGLESANTGGAPDKKQNGRRKKSKGRGDLSWRNKLDEDFGGGIMVE